MRSVGVVLILHQLLVQHVPCTVQLGVCGGRVVFLVQLFADSTYAIFRFCPKYLEQSPHGEGAVEDVNLEYACVWIHDELEVRTLFQVEGALQLVVATLAGVHARLCTHL